VRTFEAIAQKQHSGREYRLPKSPERLSRTCTADRGEPLIIQGLTPGPHRVLIELVDPTDHVIDIRRSLEIPQQSSAH
jgi:hypothetical protein